MFKLITKQSPKKYVEQARTLRVDSTTLKCLGETLLETGESFSVVTTRGISSVYSGDLSADGVAGGQGVPLVTMEYKTSAHTAYVKVSEWEDKWMERRNVLHDILFPLNNPPPTSALNFQIPPRLGDNTICVS
eukprot:TRINITY_DN4973_c0_g1_i1.p1 TRINITY_DN4973_c0_g1~~TRINITY_DN4973_c0_g1_i1.p1  ORF type:complete len:133 (-),score=1.84 TRINITY_DN4973_c0_g1_i1:141-539(-)